MALTILLGTHHHSIHIFFLLLKFSKFTALKNSLPFASPPNNNFYVLQIIMRTQPSTIYRMQQKEFLGENFIVIEDFFKKTRKTQINNPIYHLKDLEK